MIIKPIKQFFSSFTHDLKIAGHDYCKLPLCAKIQVIAFTIIAALTSFFIIGLLAFPAFKWSVQVFSPAKKSPEVPMFITRTELAKWIRRKCEESKQEYI